MLTHVTVFDLSPTQVLACSQAVCAFKQERGVNPGYYIRQANKVIIEDGPITDEKLKRCACGMVFNTLASVATHPRVSIMDAAGNKTLMCSKDVCHFKRQLGVTPGHLVVTSADSGRASLGTISVVQLRFVTAQKAERPQLTCSCCGETGFETPLKLADHVSDKHEKPVFECTCTKYFISKKEAVEHTKVHDSGFNLVCDWHLCNKRFDSATNLKTHFALAHVTVQNMNDYGCKWPGCNLRFRTSTTAKRHAQSHTVDINYLCHCGQRLHSDRDMRHHLFGQAHRLVTHKCTWPECGQELLSVAELRRHLLTHGKPKPGEIQLAAHAPHAFQRWV